MFNKNARPEDDADQIDDVTQDAGSGSEGDGMHHHEINEDEGGGFHSVHTHPDGQEDHADHATYEEAKDHMDKAFGHGQSDEDGDSDAGDDMDPSDVAGSYGRAACD